MCVAVSLILVWEKNAGLKIKFGVMNTWWKEERKREICPGGRFTSCRKWRKKDRDKEYKIKKTSWGKKEYKTLKSTVTSMLKIKIKTIVWKRGRKVCSRYRSWYIWEHRGRKTTQQIQNDENYSVTSMGQNETFKKFMGAEVSIQRGSFEMYAGDKTSRPLNCREKEKEGN